MVSLQVIESSASSASPSPPQKAIVLESWRYITACFEEALGFLPQFAVFRSDEMISLSHSDHGLSKTVALIGETYLMHLSIGDESSGPRYQRLQSESVHQRANSSQCIRQCTATNKWSSAALASTLMLTAIDVRQTPVLALELLELTWATNDRSYFMGT
jgi:hypothetical protein